MATSFFKNTQLVAGLTKALGLEGRHVKSIEISAAMNKFSTAKVEFLIRDDTVDAVAQAVADYAGDIEVVSP